MRRLSGLAVVLGASIVTPAAADAPFPVKPVRYIVPFSTGGFPDILARYLGQGLHESWGHPVVVDNRPGSGGILGAEAVLRAPADGYTLLGGTISTHAINVALRELPYDSLRDFVPVTLLAKQPSLLVAHPSLPARTLTEVLALAGRNPGRLTYGTPGTGTSMHMTAELMKLVTGADLTHVPYKSGGAVLTDVLGGHVPLAIIALPVVKPQVDAGKLRAIALTGSRRSPVMPNVATLAEQGLEGFDVTSWNALFVRSGTPPVPVRRINEAVARVLHRVDSQERFAAQGAEVGATTSELAASFVRSEVERWRKVVKTVGIRLE